MKKIYFIVNPKAGKGKGESTYEIIKNELNECDPNRFILYRTENPHHATTITKNIDDNSIVFAVGGDGTVNEVLNGIDLNKDIVFGVLPIGSGNDFAKNVKTSTSIKDLVNKIKMDSYNIRQVDLGNALISEEGSDAEIHTKFINALGIGFDAYVAFLNQNSKVFNGLISYIFAVFKAVSKVKFVDAEFEIENETISGEKLIVTLGNGHCSGGGFYLNPGAVIDDGILNLTTIEKIGKLRILKELPKALFNKLETIDIAKMYKFEQIDIRLKSGNFVHTDGEVVTANATRIKVNIIKSGIKIINLL
ncbi:MAG: YegS/Rv2252/BmrU family lipid kinase [Melioribacteraceae bacterium]|nr:YegS/Rv2252/BmrU family lipid kinase [Melioribacteraceae bacterium]MCF8352902.1 YegS/Rv2252/BmrU family lipid kinase [Melioribacteraceae bacterium]MCF8393781.1 YegS/Rv2252/BmrU family lipid kinase [Melioribacteraceae bacterium]MCF8417419.1 YegS/Rv2252/BmrU family lipid kinase [Melioribacteraceae bacterium]